MPGDVYEVRSVFSATEEPDGSFVIIEFALKGQDAAFAFPLAEIGPLVALLVQSGGRAQALAGSEHRQPSLETDGTDVFRAGPQIDVHFRLTGGLDLPMALTIQQAAALHQQLGASLASTTSSSDSARH